MDEFLAVLKAREIVDKLNLTTAPVAVEDYVKHIGAALKPQDDLEPDEPGWSFESNGKSYICVNTKDKPERRRFTICHEIAHIVLKLPSEHKSGPWWSYARRSSNEIICDVFAAELLLPYRLFKPLAERAGFGLAKLDLLADQFGASTTATGSRFAAVVRAPCAFVLAEGGKVRYASRSTALREARGWIPPRMTVPSRSVSEKVRAGGSCDEAEETDTDAWFSDWDRDGVVLEDARFLQAYDQVLTLLWFDDGELPAKRTQAAREQEEEDEYGLRELDGTLPWPGKRKRR